MAANYIYDSNSSPERLSESLQFLISGANVECHQKSNKFKSYGDGIIDDNFFVGNLITENINSIYVQNSDSYLLTIPKRGKYYIDISNKKKVEVSEKKALLVLPTDRVLYHSPTNYTNGYEIFVKKEFVNQILNNKYNIPTTKPDYFLLDVENEKIRSIMQIIDTTLSSLRSFPDIRNTRFIKRSIQEIATFMIADLIAENFKTTRITNNYPDKFLISSAERIIADECDTLFTIQEIADKLFTSPRNIQLAFKKYRDYTPMQFLRTRKLHEANKKILSIRDTKCTVKEVAFGVGMFDLNRFSKYYVEIFGELPSDTIKKSQK